MSAVLAFESPPRPKSFPIQATASPALLALLAEFGVELVPLNRKGVGPRQTKAVRTLDRLLADHGAGHLRFVLTAIVETSPGSAAALMDDAIAAVSDMLIILGDGVGGDVLATLDAFDLTDLHSRTRRLLSTVPRRQAIATLLAARLGLV
jgi:hypothetical protein